MPKDAFPALRPNQQSQRSVHDFPLGLKPRQLARLTHQTFINLNIRSAHIESMHHFRRLWCVFHSSTVFTSTFSRRSKIPTLSGPLTSISTDSHNSFESHPSRKPFPSPNLHLTVANSDTHSKELWKSVEKEVKGPDRVGIFDRRLKVEVKTVEE